MHARESRGAVQFFFFVRRLQGLGMRAWQAHVGGYERSSGSPVAVLRVASLTMGSCMHVPDACGHACGSSQSYVCHHGGVPRMGEMGSLYCHICKVQ